MDGRVTKDHYLVLGVSRTETTSGIRSVYRALAQQFHQDRLDETGALALEEINEAYEVLSDSHTRSEHNRELRQWDADPVPGGHRPMSLGPRPLESPEFSILGPPEESIRPSFEALHDRFLRNFTGVGVPKSERLEALNLDVAISAEEAARGVVLRIGVPVFEQRPERGMVMQERIVEVPIPPMLSGETTLDMPLDRFGIRNLCLRVRVSLTDDVPRARA